MRFNMRFTMRKLMSIAVLAVVLVALMTPLVSKACGGGDMPITAAPTRLWIGATALVNIDTSEDMPLALRATPDYYGNFINGLQYGTKLTVVDGPVHTAEGYVYWKVVTSDNKLTGWVAESDDMGYLLKPVPAV